MKKFTLMMQCIMAFATGANAVTVIRVASTGNNGDGSTWTNAKTTITAAQNAATAGDIIYVKGEQFNLSSSILNNSAWATKPDINYYGGFAGVDDSETPATRATSDLDNNGIVEPWEFSNATVINFTITNNGVGLNLNSNTATRYFDGFKFQGTFDYATTGSGNGQSLVKIGSYVIFQNNTLSGCTITGAPNSDVLTGSPATTPNGTSLGSLFYVGGTATTVTNCLFENNTTTITAGTVQQPGGQQNPLIYIVSASATGGNIFSNSIIRKNRVTLDYSTLTTAPTGGYTGPRGMLLGMNITSTSISNSNVIKNVIIHNNDATFIPKGGTGTTQTTNAALLYVYGATQNNTDYILNCTVANNKMTRVGWGIKAGFNNTTQPFHIIANNVAYNNVNYTGDGSFAMQNMTTNIAVSTSGSIRILNNYMNSGSGLQANGATTVVGNQTDLSDTNTDASKGAFFTSPSTPVGYSTDASVSKSLWIIGSGSYLKNKGVSNANITTDKAGRNFASTPSVGAYEQFYIRSKSSGNWNSLSSWETSNDNSTWNTSSEIPTSLASSLNIINGHEITITANATSPALTINSGGKLTLNSGDILDVTGNLNIQSDGSNGTGTFVDANATSGLTVTGTASVQQWLTGLNGTSHRGLWYISCPVSAATAAVFDVAAGTNKMTRYDETKTPNPGYVTQFTDNATALTPGVGYVAQIGGADAAYTFSTSSGSNTTKLNTGAMPVTVTRTGTTAAKRGFNLVGNPYPSYLDWKHISNTKTNLRSTIWYRVYTGSQMTFDTYDGTTGTGNGEKGDVSQYIPPMQAFWVKVDKDGDVATLAFANAARLHRDQSLAVNSLRAPAQKNTEPQIVRLRVSNGTNSDETILVANDNATDAFDTYDSEKMNNDNATIPEIYTLAGTQELVINHLSDFATNKQIALGFRPGTISNFSIVANEINNVAAQTKVILIDKLQNNAEFDLTNGTAYTFSADATPTADRFVIAFRAPGVSTNLSNANNFNMFVYSNANNQIIINRNSDVKAMVTVCNALGQKLVSTPTTGSTTVIQKSLGVGVYFVSLTAEGNESTQKVIIK